MLLNGGSCRNPLVVRAFKELDIFRNAEILDQGDLDLAVARGATVRCFYKHCRDYDPITPIVSAELGLITHGDNCEMLVAAGTRLPFPAQGEFKRFTDRFWVPKEKMERIHLPIYSGKEGNRHLVQTMSLELPKDAVRGDGVVIEMKIDLNKIMRFRAFLAEHPDAGIGRDAGKSAGDPQPDPGTKGRAWKSESAFPKSGLPTPSFNLRPANWSSLANLERLAEEPERALDILQRLQLRLKKQNEPLPASGHNILGLCYGKLGRRS